MIANYLVWPLLMFLLCSRDTKSRFERACPNRRGSQKTLGFKHFWNFWSLSFFSDPSFCHRSFLLPADLFNFCSVQRPPFISLFIWFKIRPRWKSQGNKRVPIIPTSSKTPFISYHHNSLRQLRLNIWVFKKKKKKIILTFFSYGTNTHNFNY